MQKILLLPVGIFLLTHPASLLPAQDSLKTADAQISTPGLKKNADLEKTLTTLRALKASIAETEAEIATKRILLSNSTTSAEQGAIGAAIQALNDKITRLQEDFESVASSSRGGTPSRYFS